MVDYEKGAPRNLVQFSEYNDLAFTDTGVSIDDNARPDRNVLWTSDRIEKRIAEIAGNRQNGTAIPQVRDNANLQVSVPGVSLQAQYPNGDKGYYTNGYKRHWRAGKHHLPLVLKPSWWVSWIIPSRQHYCEKCCNYMEHKWSTSWKDDLNLGNSRCSRCTSAPQHLIVPGQRMLTN